MRWLLAAGLMGVGVAAAAAPALDVIGCMRANLPDAVRVQAVEVTSYDRTGQPRTLRGRIFGARAQDRAQVMARVEFPGDLAGAAFLVRDGASAAETYMYLPATNRVKRIAGTMMAGKLWGTDFSYNEFRQVTTAFAGGATVADGTVEHAGRSAHRLLLTPAAGESPYDSIEVLVDAQTCVPLRAEFRAGAQARKLFTAEVAELRQAGKHWYAADMTLRDLAAGTRTRLRVLGVSPAEALSASYFHPQQFYNAR